MSWPASFGIACINAIAVCAGAVGLGILIVDWYQVADFNGGSVYVVILIGLIGAVAGAVIGLIIARTVAGGVDPHFSKALGTSLAASACILLVLLVGLRLGADMDPKYEGKYLTLYAQVRAPVGFEFPTTDMASEWYAYVDTRSRSQITRTMLNLTAREENGRKIIGLDMLLRTSKTEKLLYVHLGERSTELFVFSFQPNAASFDWSSWIDAEGHSGKPQPPVEQRFNARYKLVVVRQD
ncbi:MAG: hypothetical protein ABJB66_11305 [Gemmatimonadaceae bacterium]